MANCKVEKSAQVKYNFYSNLGNLIVNILVGVLYTPYLVKSLGPIAYGIIPLALVVNQYINVLAGSLTSSITRFYSLSLHGEDNVKASKSLSTAIASMVILSLLLCPIFYFILNRLGYLFVIPPDLIISSKYLFLFTFISLLISLYTSVLNVSLYANNRLDLINIIKSARVFFKFIFIYFLFLSFSSDIKYVGIANLSTEILVFFMSLAFHKKMNKDIIISKDNLDKFFLAPMLVMTLWVIIHQIGDTGIYRIDNIVFNRLFGLEFSGALGAISEFGQYILLVVSLLSSLFGPLILIAYSKGNHDEVINHAINSSYITGLISAMLAGIIAGLSGNILRIWLGDSYEQYHLWLSIKMCAIPFFASGGVLAFVYRAWNKVKMPAISTLLLGVVNVGFIFLSINYNRTFLTPLAILMICALFAILQSYFLNVYFVGKLYRDSQNKLLLSALKYTTLFIISFLLSRFINQAFEIESILLLIVQFLSLGIVLSVIGYLFFLNEMHRSILKLIVFK